MEAGKSQDLLLASRGAHASVQIQRQGKADVSVQRPSGGRNALFVLYSALSGLDDAHPQWESHGFTQSTHLNADPSRIIFTEASRERSEEASGHHQAGT